MPQFFNKFIIVNHMSYTGYNKQWCERIYNELIRKKLTIPFRNPVDPVRDGAENYFDIVQTPMDLSTIGKKMNSKQYKRIQEFIDDVNLMCDNAILFNHQESLIGYMAADIKEWVAKQIQNKTNSPEEEWEKRLENVINKLQKHISKSPALHKNGGKSNENEKDEKSGGRNVK